MSAEVLAQAAGWLDQGRGVAVATVIRTWGSSPRPVGSVLAVDAAGAMAGSVSGGCIESSVVHQALQVIEDGEPRRLGYGVTDEMAWEVGLPCGGRIELYLEPAPRRDLLDRLLAAQARRQPVALVTDLITGLKTLVFETVVHGAFGLDEPALDEVRRCLAADRSALIELSEDSRLFVHSLTPPLRLLVVGAVHIAQALAPMAQRAGWEVTVIDPRRTFATAERFPGVTLVDAWPDEALAALAPDGATAVVTLSHDRKLDDPALIAALRTPAFYVGALGSRKAQAGRLERLREAGFGAEDLGRIRGPVGLAIGAVTPAEIAVSILAGLIAERRQGALLRP